MNYLSNETVLWNLFIQIIEPNYPSQIGLRGRPRSDLRQIFSGCLYILRTGCTWRNLPSEFGPFSTCHGYFLKWTRAGFIEKLWIMIRTVCSAFNGYDRSIETIDASERHVKNMKGKNAGYGYKIKGKRAVKITILSDKDGLPVGLDVHKSGPHDVTRFKQALKDGHKIPGLQAESIILGDAGYLGNEPIKEAIKLGCHVITSKRINQKCQNTPKEKKLLKKYRWQSESLFSELYSYARVERCLDFTPEAFKSWSLLALICIIASV